MELPPHGGIAPGIDRIVMLLANEKNIREVTMFPMNQNAQDLMMQAPSDVNLEQLKELNIKILEKKIINLIFCFSNLFLRCLNLLSFIFVITSNKTFTSYIFY